MAPTATGGQRRQPPAAKAAAEARRQGEEELRRWGSAAAGAKVAPFAGPYGPVIVPNPRYFQERKHDRSRSYDLAWAVGARAPWDGTAVTSPHWLDFFAPREPRPRRTRSAAHPPRAGAPTANPAVARIADTLLRTDGAGVQLDVDTALLRKAHPDLAPEGPERTRGAFHRWARKEHLLVVLAWPGGRRAHSLEELGRLGARLVEPVAGVPPLTLPAGETLRAWVDPELPWAEAKGRTAVPVQRIGSARPARPHTLARSGARVPALFAAGGLP